MKILPRGNGVATHDHLLILDSSIVELESPMLIEP